MLNNQPPMTMWVTSQTTVKSIKLDIHENNRGPLIEDQRLMFRGVGNIINFLIRMNYW